MSFAMEILRGDIRSTAPLIRDIEDEMPAARDQLKQIYSHNTRSILDSIEVKLNRR